MSQKELTAVEWFVEELSMAGYFHYGPPMNLVKKAKEIEREQKILLVEELKDYTKESQCILGNDEREASEFVDIFYDKTFKQQEQ
jgi:hypothetical protein